MKTFEEPKISLVKFQSQDICAVSAYGLEIHDTQIDTSLEIMDI